MPYYARLTLFVVIVTICVFLLLYLFFHNRLKAFFMKRNVTRFYYRKVMKEAQKGDYYLVNDILYRLGGSDYVHIDHVLGGDKFIYVITDIYYEGAVSGKSTDAYWINYFKKDKKKKVANPILQSKQALERFSKASGINTSFLVGIVLVNDDCFITPIDSRRDEPLLTPLSRLGKVVSAYEKNDVYPFVSQELEKVMVSLHEDKERVKNGD